MEYEKFKKIFNETIFEKSKVVLLEKIAKYPNRYVGLFRPTKPKGKILQNLLQSHEIRFGDAFELLIEEYLKILGFTILDKRFSTGNDEKLNVDQCFRDADSVYFIEQKVRDDHDSTKKRGQMDNFAKKLDAVIKKYTEKEIKGILYFIDPNLKKNKNYYRTELESLSQDYGVNLHLFYGEELFTFLDKEEVWKEILDHLKQWKTDIPDLPEINFDTDAQNTFEELKGLSPSLFRKLFTDDIIFDDILLTIFPEKRTLALLLNYFKERSKEKKIYETLADMLEARLS